LSQAKAEKFPRFGVLLVKILAMILSRASWSGALLKAGVTFNVIVPTCAMLGVAVAGISLAARAVLLRK
jgi:hypothetical protein